MFFAYAANRMIRDRVLDTALEIAGIVTSEMGLLALLAHRLCRSVIAVLLFLHRVVVLSAMCHGIPAYRYSSHIFNFLSVRFVGYQLCNLASWWSWPGRSCFPFALIAPWNVSGISLLLIQWEPATWRVLIAPKACSRFLRNGIFLACLQVPSVLSHPALPDRLRAGSH